MRHLADAQRLGEVVGFDVDSRSDTEREAIERTFDEVFERGYQAGLVDAAETSEYVL